MPQSKHWCSDCGKVTEWQEYASGKAKCQGCGTTFPCLRCQHWDCMEQRGEAAPDERGIMRVKEKGQHAHADTVRGGREG